jgi:hypothetical protein
MTWPYPIIFDSYARSNATAGKAAGAVGWVRYCPGPNVDPAKTCTADEVKALEDQDMTLVLVGERGTQDWRGGYSAGVKDGTGYRAGATSIGYGTGATIYASADTDVLQTDVPVLMDYAHGFNIGAGQEQNGGLYADGGSLSALHSVGLIKYPWQTESNGFWGSGTVYSACVLHQRTSHVLQFGGVDENDVLSVDYGQHNYKPIPVPEDEMNPCLIVYVQDEHGNPLPSRWVVDQFAGTKHLFQDDAVHKEHCAQVQLSGGTVVEHPATQAYVDSLTSV